MESLRSWVECTLYSLNQTSQSLGISKSVFVMEKRREWGGKKCKADLFLGLARLLDSSWSCLQCTLSSLSQTFEVIVILESKSQQRERRGGREARLTLFLASRESLQSWIYSPWYTLNRTSHSPGSCSKVCLFARACVYVYSFLPLGSTCPLRKPHERKRLRSTSLAMLIFSFRMHGPKSLWLSS